MRTFCYFLLLMSLSAGALAGTCSCYQASIELEFGVEWTTATIVNRSGTTLSGIRFEFVDNPRTFQILPLVNCRLSPALVTDALVMVKGQIRPGGICMARWPAEANLEKAAWLHEGEEIVQLYSLPTLRGFRVFDNEDEFYASLNPDTVVVVDFDHFPDGTPVPTGYDRAGNWSGYELKGDEWASLGITFSTPSGQPMSTVHITEFEGTWHNYSSPPNSLTIGQPPFVGYGVVHSENTEDSLCIHFSPARRAAGLVFIDNAPTDKERVIFRAEDGSVIAELPSPFTGYLSFLGIIADTPIAYIEIIEEKYDGDDVAYDDIVTGDPL